MEMKKSVSLYEVKLRNLRDSVMLTISMALSLAFMAGCHGHQKKEEVLVDTINVDRPSKLEGVPYRDSADVKSWGLVSLSGQVLVSPRYTLEPSNVVNGRFVVRNANGLYEYYTADAEPKKIGGEYTQAGLFYEDIAPCVEKGKPYIQFIRRDGSLAFRLDSVNGHKVQSVGSFQYGMARFKADGLWGYINVQGKVAIAPQYAEAKDFRNGLALVVDTADGNGRDFRLKQEYKIKVVDATGKLAKAVFSSRDSIGKYFSEGLICVMEQPRDSTGTRWHFVDKDGTVVIPSCKDYLKVSSMYGTHFAFYNGTGWGIADNQMTSIVEPTLDDVVFIGTSSAAIKKYGVYKIVDYRGEALSKSYTKMKYLHNRQNFIVFREGTYCLLDIEGEEKSKPMVMIDDNDFMHDISL